MTDTPQQPLDPNNRKDPRHPEFWNHMEELRDQLKSKMAGPAPTEKK
jgi:hypothetical protein